MRSPQSLKALADGQRPAVRHEKSFDGDAVSAARFIRERGRSAPGMWRSKDVVRRNSLVSGKDLPAGGGVNAVRASVSSAGGRRPRLSSSSEASNNHPPVRTEARRKVLTGLGNVVTNDSSGSENDDDQEDRELPASRRAESVISLGSPGGNLQDKVKRGLRRRRTTEMFLAEAMHRAEQTGDDGLVDFVTAMIEDNLIPEPVQKHKPSSLSLRKPVEDPNRIPERKLPRNKEPRQAFTSIAQTILNQTSAAGKLASLARKSRTSSVQFDEEDISQGNTRSRMGSVSKSRRDSTVSIESASSQPRVVRGFSREHTLFESNAEKRRRNSLYYLTNKPDHLLTSEEQVTMQEQTSALESMLRVGTAVEFEDSEGSEPLSEEEEFEVDGQEGSALPTRKGSMMNQAGADQKTWGKSKKVKERPTKAPINKPQAKDYSFLHKRHLWEEADVIEIDSEPEEEEEEDKKGTTGSQKDAKPEKIKRDLWKIVRLHQKTLGGFQLLMHKIRSRRARELGEDGYVITDIGKFQEEAEVEKAKREGTYKPPFSYWEKVSAKRTAALEAKKKVVWDSLLNKVNIENIKKWQQGEVSLYDEERSKERWRLRRGSKAIHENIEFLWKSIKKNKKGTVGKTAYKTFAKSVYRYLLDKDDIGNAKELDDAINEDWTSDTGGEQTLDHYHFFVAMFELADKWTETTDEREYVDFLFNLRQCTKNQGQNSDKKPSLKLRRRPRKSSSPPETPTESPRAEAVVLPPPPPPETVGLSKAGWHYHTIDVTDRQMKVDIKMITTKGDADMYIKIGKKPTFTDCDWKKNTAGDDSLLITPQDPRHRVGRYFVGIYAFHGSEYHFSYELSMQMIPAITAKNNKKRAALLEVESDTLYRFRAPDPTHTVIIKLEVAYGGAHMFVSQVHSVPNEEKNMWRSESDQGCTLTITSEDRYKRCQEMTDECGVEVLPTDVYGINIRSGKQQTLYSIVMKSIPQIIPLLPGQPHECKVYDYKQFRFCEINVEDGASLYVLGYSSEVEMEIFVSTKSEYPGRWDSEFRSGPSNSPSIEIPPTDARYCPGRHRIAIAGCQAGMISVTAHVGKANDNIVGYCERRGTVPAGCWHYCKVILPPGERADALLKIRGVGESRADLIEAYISEKDPFPRQESFRWRSHLPEICGCDVPKSSCESLQTFDSDHNCHDMCIRWAGYRDPAYTYYLAIRNTNSADFLFAATLQPLQDTKRLGPVTLVECGRQYSVRLGAKASGLDCVFYCVKIKDNAIARICAEGVGDQADILVSNKHNYPDYDNRRWTVSSLSVRSSKGRRAQEMDAARRHLYLYPDEYGNAKYLFIGVYRTEDTPPLWWDRCSIRVSLIKDHSLLFPGDIAKFMIDDGDVAYYKTVVDSSESTGGIRCGVQFRFSSEQEPLDLYASSTCTFPGAPHLPVPTDLWRAYKSSLNSCTLWPDTRSQSRSCYLGVYGPRKADYVSANLVVPPMLLDFDDSRVGTITSAVPAHFMISKDKLISGFDLSNFSTVPEHSSCADSTNEGKPTPRKVHFPVFGIRVVVAIAEDAEEIVEVVASQGSNMFPCPERCRCKTRMLMDDPNEKDDTSRGVAVLEIDDVNPSLGPVFIGIYHMPTEANRKAPAAMKFSVLAQSNDGCDFALEGVGDVQSEGNPILSTVQRLVEDIAQKTPNAGERLEMNIIDEEEQRSPAVAYTATPGDSTIVSDNEFSWEDQIMQGDFSESDIQSSPTNSGRATPVAMPIALPVMPDRRETSSEILDLRDAYRKALKVEGIWSDSTTGITPNPSPRLETIAQSPDFGVANDRALLARYDAHLDGTLARHPDSRYSTYNMRR